MRTAAPERKTIAGMECVGIECAAKFMGLSVKGLEKLIRARKRSRSKRNFPMIQLGGPGSFRWFPLEIMKNFVIETNKLDQIGG